MAYRLLIGCGYLGARVAETWHRNGDEVEVLTRSGQKAASMHAGGWRAVVGDVGDPRSLLPLGNKSEPIDSLVYAVGHDRAQSATIGEVYAGGLQNVLNALGGRPLGRLIYVSTTGVYGDAEGDWIDEATPPSPGRPGGIASLAAEEVVRQSRYARHAIILRLAGIYGPGRLPYVDLLRRGEPLQASPDGFLNLIHVVDAAAIVVAFSRGEQERRGPLVYCVSDGHPVRREQYYRTLAAQLQAPEPRFAPDASDARVLRATTSKRVRNRKLLDDLGYEFRYPTCREGIADLITSR